MLFKKLMKFLNFMELIKEYFPGYEFFLMLLEVPENSLKIKFTGGSWN